MLKYQKSESHKMLMLLTTVFIFLLQKMPNFSKGKYHQHDNRGRYQQDPVIRKVSFKNNQRGRGQRGNRRGGQGRGFENQMREYFHSEIIEDQDFLPGPSSSYHRGKPIRLLFYG